MNGIPRLQQFEAVYGSEAVASGKRLSLQAEQKSVDQTMDLVAKLSDSRDLILGFYAETMKVAKRVLLFSEHGRFFGCKMNESCVINPNQA